MVLRYTAIVCFMCLIGVQQILTEDTAAGGVDYLYRYGYLKMPDFKSGELQSRDELIDAIKSMQRFMGLPETGEIDADTMAMMQKPRCGLPDIMGTSEDARKKRYALVGKWEKNDLTYKILNYTPDLAEADTSETIRLAFDIWQAVTPLTFTEIYDGTPDINILFARGYHGDGGPFDGPGGTLAHAYFPGGGLGGDAHFDDDETFTIRTYDGTNLLQVAAHEFGHSLGLGHSSVYGALMAPYYQGYAPDYVLPEDDKRGIQALYGSAPSGPVEPEMPEITNMPGKPIVPTYGPCETGYDAISSIRGELFIFKDDQFWRLREFGKVLSGYPVKNSLFWYDMPNNIDATYERYDNIIMFFKGTKYWEYTANYPDSDSPKYTNYLGLPNNIDAALVWENNGKTYFFKGKQYWRYDEYNQQVDPGYPRQIYTTWKGVPNNIDAAFNWKDGYTYFFKGDNYWKFDANTMEVDPGYPRKIAVDWMGCNSLTEENNEQENGIGTGEISSSQQILLSPVVILSTFILFFILFTN
ncbi:matrix metalloproteinase-14-like [Saccoglossus kowalevskii]|uniref:Matrix metalloproteinase-24-like n=1 Tax=Saccoglossus kowalevskii TaxID=10224 RepID=A0ABM0GW19_SACKO|nr:PREDICTED: matrix metalloproteinase-24-like [Saccoglossus kowalevskii]